MKTTVIVVCLAVLHPALVRSAVFDIEYDHAAGKFRCSRGQTVLSDGVAPCGVEALEGDDVTVRVVNTVPSLFVIEITKEDRPISEISIADARRLGLAPPSADSGAAVATTDPSKLDTPAKAYDALVRAAANFRDRAARRTFDALEVDQRMLVAALDAIDRLTTGQTADAIHAELATNVGQVMPKEQFAILWEAAQKIRGATVVPTEGPSALFTLDGRDFDVVLRIVPSNAIVANAELVRRTPVRLRESWSISTSTGLAFSGLTDHHYTVRTETVTGQDEQGQPVERQVRKAVLEREDVLEQVQAALMVHVTPRGAGAPARIDGWGDFGRLLAPDQLTFGMGTSSGGQARAYLGLSWRLGRAASLTAGGAGGNVKRLSRNIDPDDLGPSADPEAARRDVFDTSWMLGFTVRIGGE